MGERELSHPHSHDMYKRGALDAQRRAWNLWLSATNVLIGGFHTRPAANSSYTAFVYDDAVGGSWEGVKW